MFIGLFDKAVNLMRRKFRLVPASVSKPTKNCLVSTVFSPTGFQDERGEERGDRGLRAVWVRGCPRVSDTAGLSCTLTLRERARARASEREDRKSVV